MAAAWSGSGGCWSMRAWCWSRRQNPPPDGIIESPPVIARSPCDEAIHSFFLPRDGLLRFARNDDEGWAKALYRRPTLLVIPAAYVRSVNRQTDSGGSAKSFHHTWRSG